MDMAADLGERSIIICRDLWPVVAEKRHGPEAAREEEGGNVMW